MNSKIVETELRLKFKGPFETEDLQILEAAILHFILKLPTDMRPFEGEEIDVSQWIGGRLPKTT